MLEQKRFGGRVIPGTEQRSKTHFEVTRGIRKMRRRSATFSDQPGCEFCARGGQRRSRGGNLDVALGLAQTAVQQVPDDPAVNDTLGWIYYKKELPGRAIAAFQKSVEKDSANPVYHYHLALAYSKNGDRVMAKRFLEKALAIASDFDGSSDARQLLTTLR